MRVRGLKQIAPFIMEVNMKSHPMRVRGLKLYSTFYYDHIRRRTPCGCVD